MDESVKSDDNLGPNGRTSRFRHNTHFLKTFLIDSRPFRIQNRSLIVDKLSFILMCFTLSCTARMVRQTN